MEQKKIIVSDKTLLGCGISSDVYTWETDKIIKLFHKSFSQEQIMFEYKNAVYMQQCGLPVPKCYGLVECEDRKGLIYEQIHGQDMMKKYYEDSDKANEEFVERLTSLHKQILSHQADELISYKELLFIYARDDFKLKRQIVRLPDGNTLCHGDFQPANVMLQEDGSLRLLDFMDVCKGVSEYDIARCYYFFRYAQGDSSLTLQDKEREVIAKEYLNRMGMDEQSISPFIEIFNMLHLYNN